MAQRRKIGLVFSNNENWIGGTYYILNLIHALNTLEEDKKPTIIIFSDKEKDYEIVRNTTYPFLEFKNLTFQYTFGERVLNKIFRTFFGGNFKTKQHSPSICEAVFPFNGEEALTLIPQPICWIPDFQEHYLSHLFTEEQVKKRKQHQSKLLSSKLDLVLSSQDSFNSFQEIYPSAKNKVQVINFAVTHPQYQHLDIEALKQKFKINNPYFISPNQFWSHKNHIVILEAVKLLSSFDLSFEVVFTGKEYDPRSPDYTEKLKNFVKDNQLTEKVKFLGFIDRSEQLQLMKHAVAVIQPSLFEGWSTVVEDAKAMNQRTILSDLEVHKEQQDANATLFERNNPKDLAECIENILLSTPTITSYNYQDNITTFAHKFLSCVSSRNND